MNKREQEIQARLESASEGPWEVGHEPQLNMVAECGDTNNGQPVYIFAYHLASVENDAEFIVHSPDDIRYLLGQLERVREELSKAKLSREPLLSLWFRVNAILEGSESDA